MSDEHVEYGERDDKGDSKSPECNQIPPASVLPDRIGEPQADASRDEDRGIGERERQWHGPDECPHPARLLRSSQPLCGEHQQEHGDQKVRGVGLGLGCMANRMHAYRKYPDRQQKGDRIGSENSPCQVAEEKHARQPADEWKEAEGPFGESPQVDDESLGPEEQRRGDLPIIQRFEKLSISAINEVDR